MASIPSQELEFTVCLEDVTDQAPPSSSTLITEPDNEVMQAVENNDVEKLKEILANRENVDVNFINAKGETPLQMAVKNKSMEIIQILMNNGADIRDALIQAVSEESLEFVKILLEFQEQNSDFPISSESNNIYRATPLILAAKNNSYDIVKFLVSKGQFIDDRDFHDRVCECAKCEYEGRLGCSLRRLNVYRGLGSPVYLSLTYINKPLNPAFIKQDPIIRAFILNKQLLRLSETEYELKKEYLALSKQCEDFAIALLDECRNMSEVEPLMNIPMLEDMQYVKVLGRDEVSKKLSVLNFAIKNDNKKFVAHSYSQMMLNSVLYKGFRKWENFGAFRKVIFCVFYTLLLPLLSLMYIFCPENHWSKRLNIPLVKFVAHSGSFCIFLILLFLSSIQDIIVNNPLQVSYLDVLLIFWIIGIAVEEGKEIIRQGRNRYLSQFWNIITLLMLLLFFISGVLWISAHALSKVNGAVSLKEALGTSKDALQSYKLILISNSCFAMAYLLAFLHISNTFQVNSVMGPLQLSLIKMMRDILKFFFLFVLIYAAFTMAFRKVYSRYVWAEKMYGNKTLPSNGFASVLGSMRLTFWAVFDKTDLSELETKSFPVTKIPQNTGELLFALFNICIILVGLNMLIAMMSNSFQSIEDNSDVHWKFSRTKMWMQFIDKGSALPPPFNIIPNVTDILKMFRLLFNKWCRCQCDNCGEHGGRDVLESPLNDNDSHKREKLIIHLIQRHFYHLEKDRS